MADHYRAAIEFLHEAEALSGVLVSAYEDQEDRATIGRLHHEYGHNLKLADIHATLAVRQALQDQHVYPVGVAT